MSSRFLLTQAEIAERSGLSQQYISNIINGNRQPSIDTAESLGEASGICAEAFLWPDRHWNPYIPFTDATNCMTCPNRIKRARWFYANAPQRVGDGSATKTIKAFVREAYKYFGFPDWIVTVFRKITPTGLRLITARAPMEIPLFIKKEEVPWIYGQSTIHVPYFPYDLPPEAARDAIFSEPYGLTSLLCINRGWLHFVMWSTKQPIKYSPEIIEATERFLEKLVEIRKPPEEEEASEGRG